MWPSATTVASSGRARLMRSVPPISRFVNPATSPAAQALAYRCHDDFQPVTEFTYSQMNGALAGETAHAAVEIRLRNRIVALREVGNGTVGQRNGAPRRIPSRVRRYGFKRGTIGIPVLLAALAAGRHSLPSVC